MNSRADAIKDISYRHYSELLSQIDPQVAANVAAAVECVVDTVVSWDGARGEEVYERPVLNRTQTWGEAKSCVSLTPMVVTGADLVGAGVPHRALRPLGAPAAGRIAKKLRFENCALITFRDSRFWGFGQPGIIIDLSTPNIIYHRHSRKNFNPPAWFRRFG